MEAFLAPFLQLKINLKSLSKSFKSIWNHFLEDFSRKISSGSSFAPFLQLKSFWNHFQNHFEITFWKTFPGKSPLEAILEPNFGHSAASSPAIKSAFWDHWETAVLGQILAGSLLEPNFGPLAASRPGIQNAFWDYFLRPFWAKSWPDSLCCFWRPRLPSKNQPSGSIHSLLPLRAPLAGNGATFVYVTPVCCTNLWLSAASKVPVFFLDVKPRIGAHKPKQTAL